MSNLKNCDRHTENKRLQFKQGASHELGGLIFLCQSILNSLLWVTTGNGKNRTLSHVVRIWHDLFEIPNAHSAFSIKRTK